MPRYHIIVQYGSLVLPNQQGMEFSGFEEARDEAIRMFGPTSTCRPEQLRSGRDWTVDLTDAAGGVLFSLHVFASETAHLWPYHLSSYA